MAYKLTGNCAVSRSGTQIRSYNLLVRKIIQTFCRCTITKHCQNLQCMLCDCILADVTPKIRNMVHTNKPVRFDLEGSQLIVCSAKSLGHMQMPSRMQSHEYFCLAVEQHTHALQPLCNSKGLNCSSCKVNSLEPDCPRADCSSCYCLCCQLGTCP